MQSQISARERGEAPVRHLSFRHDINGLRAIAVALVIVFHYDLLPIHGGFVGVDVFFVISGFLITSIIAKDVDRGRYTPWAFYAARFWRIVPALALLCLALLTIGFVWIEPIAFEDLGRSIVASLLFVSNITYLLSADYFDSAAQQNWLLHTWSLSVEGQFYLVYPLMLAFVLSSRRLRASTTRLLILGLLSSLLASAVLTPLGPKYAFYLLPTRAWEFLIGAVASRLDVSKLRRTSAFRALPYAGLALILFSACWFDSFTPWPSAWALVPTIGAALVIVAHQDTAAWARNSVVRSIGLWSYSLYLWHWPFVVGLRYVTGEPTAWTLGVALALTLASAIASYHLVEQTMNRGATSGEGRPALWRRAILVLVSGVLAAAFLDQRTGGLASRLQAPGWVMPYRAALADNAYPASCGGLTLRGAVRTCDLGDVAAVQPHARILVIGDSFAQQWYGAVRDYVAREPNSAATFATYGGCPIVPGVARARPGFRCAAYLDAVYRFAASPDYGTVLIGSIWLPYFDPPYGAAGLNTDAVCFRSGQDCSMVTEADAFAAATDHAFAGFEQAIAALRAAGKRVVLIEPQPFGDVHIPREMAKRAFLNGGQADRLWIDGAAYDRRLSGIAARLRGIAQRTGAEVVDTRPLTCNGGRCMTADAAGRPLYMDQIHLRSSVGIRSGLIARIIAGRDPPVSGRLD